MHRNVDQLARHRDLLIRRNTGAPRLVRMIETARPPAMSDRPPNDASPFVPVTTRLSTLEAAARTCRGCGLYRQATQTVFGEGPARAVAMLVGEQPGDQEDRQGHPFVGPAGKLLDRALADAGIDRARVFVTNAVKHFKWLPRGKRRLHSKPSALEVRACQPWLEAEIRAVKPAIVVCLGATAAQALLGRAFRVTAQRGRVLRAPLADRVLATVHPSSILRARDDASRHAALAQFVRDLKVVARALE
jgi:DNA polymerase